MIINNPNNKIQTVISGGDMDDGKEGLRSAVEDLFSAYESKDVEGAVSALLSFFQMADEMPHEEGEHMSDGGLVESPHWSMGEVDPYGVDPVTAQEAEARYMGERYRR